MINRMGIPPTSKQTSQPVACVALLRSSSCSQSLAAPLLLGTLWALLPGLMASVLITIRTAFEDRMLQTELAGYQEYAQEVGNRLVPGIW